MSILASYTCFEDYGYDDENILKAISDIEPFLGTIQTIDASKFDYACSILEKGASRAHELQESTKKNLSRLLKLSQEQQASPRILRVQYCLTNLQAKPSVTTTTSTKKSIDNPYHDAQKAKILEVINRLLQDYVFKASKSPSETMFRNIRLEQINKLLPEYVENIFFTIPGNLTLSQKNFAITVLHHTQVFFNQYRMAYTNLREKKVKPCELTIDQEEIAILTEINKLRTNLKEPLFISAEMQQADILLSEMKVMKKLVTVCISKFSEHQLSEPIITIIASYAVEIFEMLASANSFDIFIERFLLDEMQAPPEEDLNRFSADDVAFSQLAGDKAYRLMRDFITVSGVDNFFINRALDATSLLKENLGMYIQRFLNRITNSSCTLKPILILDHLLWKVENNQYIPLTQFHETIVQSEQEKFFRSIQSKVQNIVSEAMGTTFGSKLTDPITKRFCRFSRQPKLIKMFLLYLINALTCEIENSSLDGTNKTLSPL